MPENPLDQIPDVNFSPETPEEILAEMISDYEAEYLRLTGEKKSLVPSSNERIYINTEAYRFYLTHRLIDYCAKMNLLKYSEREFLDNLAAMAGISRRPAKYSVTRVQFKLFAKQPNSTIIPKGTRVSNSQKIYFETKSDTIIPADADYAIVDVISIESGASTAGLLPGQINILVDPVAGISSVENMEPTQGGADIENDESLRLRVYHQPDSLSVAGPLSAYEYFVRQYSQVIEDVSPKSPTPGVVDIRFTLAGGQLPEQAIINDIIAYLEDKRPDTDMLTVAAPDIKLYNLDCTFYIAKSDKRLQADIIEKVNGAVEEYLKYQSGKIGRDINPDMLTKLAVMAGAKRIIIRSPQYAVTGDTIICRHSSVNAEYGGIEDD